mmetsp:Transcript_35740/g.76301  ORF Transcript_35740/g.76301 Transcript_35740/m.76301 type:complete len:257 (-) Transcript_35740:242-1012(-)
MSRFNVQQASAEDQRPAHEVFKSARNQDETFKSRFETAGRFTTQQLESGADLEVAASEQPASNEDGQPEFDPNDTRSLYEKLKEQRDAKQEEYEEKHKFKNQMDHWRLDEDGAQFEDERIEQQQRQQAEAQRKHEEGAEFYKLARAAQEREIPEPPKLDVTPWESKPGAVSKRKRTELPKMAVRVVAKQKGATNTVVSRASAPTRVPAPAPAAAPAAAPAPTPAPAAAPAPAVSESESVAVGGGLPGMDDYSDDED